MVKTDYVITLVGKGIPTYSIILDGSTAHSLSLQVALTFQSTDILWCLCTSEKFVTANAYYNILLIFTQHKKEAERTRYQRYVGMAPTCP